MRARKYGWWRKASRNLYFAFGLGAFVRYSYTFSPTNTRPPVVRSHALREHLEGAERSLLFGELFRLTVEPPILAAPSDSECLVGTTRGPAVSGEVPRVVGASEQFGAEVTVATAEQGCLLPRGAVGTLELALPTHPEPPEYDAHGHFLRQERQAVKIGLES